jgi:CHAT domain-containing protein/Tfp pilus assembly protein PilF
MKILLMLVFTWMASPIFQVNAQVYKEAADSASDLLATGEYEKALNGFKQIIKKTGRVNFDRDYAEYFEQMGYLCYWMNEIDDAAYYYKKSLKHQIQNNGHTEDIQRSLIGLGEVYLMQGNFQEALRLFLQADLLPEGSSKGSVSKAEIKLRIGRIYYTFGDYQKALKYLLLAHQLAKIRTGDKPVIDVYILISIGEEYFSVHEYAKSIAYFRQALQSEFFVEEHRPYCESMLADAFEKSGQEDSSSFYVKKLLKAKSGMTADCYQVCARYFYKRGDWDQSYRYYKLGMNLTLSQLGFLHPDNASSYYYLGSYWNKRNQPDSAISNLNKALAALGIDPASATAKNSLLFHTPYVRHLMPVLSERARAFYLKALQSPDSLLSYLKKSIDEYETVVNFIRRTYSNFQSDDSRIFLSETESSVYVSAIKTSLALYRETHDKSALEKAFYFAEQSKAGALMSTFRQRDAFDLAGVPFVFKGAEASLNSAIYQTEQQLLSANNVNTSQNVKLRDRLIELYKWKTQLNRAIILNYPAYERLGWTGHTPGLRQVQESLDANTAFVEYVCDSTQLYIFAVNDHSYQLKEVAIDSSFFGKLKEYRKQLSHAVYYTSRTEYLDFLMLSHDLWTSLIGPCEQILKGKSRLMVAQDARLAGISFDALIAGMPDTSAIREIDFRSPDYLIRHFAVSYCYSAMWLFSAETEQGDRSNKALMAFAPVYNEGDQGNYTPIDSALKEAKTIAEKWKGSLFSGADATKEKFLEVEQNAQILHLAMHSASNEEEPLASKLIFSGSDSSLTGLSAGDIYSINVPADLVVLNSCNSGYGKSIQGEGMMSLARAFIYAGSKSVIMTMWPVQDASGARIMENFYDRLAEGKPTDVALREAKLYFLDHAGSIQTHPCYWAPYSLTGRSTTIRIGASQGDFFLNTGILAGILILSLILYMPRIFLRHQHNP